MWPPDRLSRPLTRTLCAAVGPQSACEVHADALRVLLTSLADRSEDVRELQRRLEEVLKTTPVPAGPLLLASAEALRLASRVSGGRQSVSPAATYSIPSPAERGKRRLILATRCDTATIPTRCAASPVTMYSLGHGELCWTRQLCNDRLTFNV